MQVLRFSGWLDLEGYRLARRFFFLRAHYKFVYRLGLPQYRMYPLWVANTDALWVVTYRTAVDSTAFILPRLTIY